MGCRSLLVASTRLVLVSLALRLATVSIFSHVSSPDMRSVADARDASIITDKNSIKKNSISFYFKKFNFLKNSKNSKFKMFSKVSKLILFFIFQKNSKIFSKIRKIQNFSQKFEKFKIFSKIQKKF